VDIFVLPRTRTRHEEAPLWPERQQYLLHLLRQGTNRRDVCSTAAILLHVVRLLDLSRMRPVNGSEIREAGERWATDTNSHLTGKPGKRSSVAFSARARSCFVSTGNSRKTHHAVSVAGLLRSLTSIVGEDAISASTTVHRNQRKIAPVGEPVVKIRSAILPPLPQAQTGPSQTFHQSTSKLLPPLSCTDRPATNEIRLAFIPASCLGGSPN
jgi:hypothetical protein